MSSPAALSAAIISSPLKTVDATFEDRKSPASTRSGVRPAAASFCLSVATRAEAGRYV